MTKRAPIERVYVVFWPAHDVFKVGYTGRRRWVSFLNRGAELVELYEFPSSTDALAVESFIQTVAWQTQPRAFTTGSGLARELLGDSGAGYLECYSGTRQECESTIARAKGQALLVSNAQVGK